MRSREANTPEQPDELVSLLSDAGTLPAAFLALRQQLEVQTELVDKKSEVIQNQQVRIAVLEEQLRCNKVERFAASSESNPLQARLFNEVEQECDAAEVTENQAGFGIGKHDILCNRINRQRLPRYSITGRESLIKQNQYLLFKRKCRMKA